MHRTTNPKLIELRLQEMPPIIRVQDATTLTSGKYRHTSACKVSKQVVLLILHDSVRARKQRETVLQSTLAGWRLRERESERERGIESEIQSQRYRVGD